MHLDNTHFEPDAVNYRYIYLFTLLEFCSLTPQTDIFMDICNFEF
jgi:hypothetical protein